MIPRNEIVAVDIEDDVNKITEQILNYKHTRIPIYQSELNSHNHPLLCGPRPHSRAHHGAPDHRPVRLVPQVGQKHVAL